MSFRHFWLRQQFDTEARALFYETLRDKARDNISVFQVIKQIEASASIFKVFPAEVMVDIMNSMRGSQRGREATLGAALGRWSSPMESALIAAGERAGRIDVALHEAAELLRMQSKMRGLVVSRFTYPLILILMVAALLAALGQFLVPMLEQMAPRDKWTPAASFMGFLADNSVVLTVGMLGSIAVGGALFTLAAGKWTGALRDQLDRHLPIWSHYRSTQGSIALTTISMLTATGVPMSDAVDLVKRHASPWMAEHMARIKMRMRSGQDAGFALAGDGGVGTLFDSYTAWQITLYGSNSNMSSKLRSLSSDSSNRVTAALSKLAAVVQWTAMTAVAGLLVLTYFSYMSVTSAATTPGGLA